MNLAFILDPLDTLQLKKDSSIAMMRKAERLGYVCWTIMRNALYWQEGFTHARAERITLAAQTAVDQKWYSVAEQRTWALRDFSAVLMRQDPPFDDEYLAATWLLERAEMEGALVVNRPAAIRDHSEKISITEFPQFCVPTLIAREKSVIDDFINQEHDVILKPLDGMGGRGIFRVRATDHNRNVIIETITKVGARSIMAQRYIPEIEKGDKRILLIDGKPLPYALARIPHENDQRGNLAAGAKGVAQLLSKNDIEIATTIGAVLAPRGLLLVGLDVIGNYLTEINVTSPTCFVEIETQSGIDVADIFMRALGKNIQRLAKNSQ